MENLIKIEEFKKMNDLESNKAAILFGIHTTVSQELYKLGMKFNFENFKFEGYLPINNTILKVTIYKEQDSHGKRFSILIREKYNGYLKDYKGNSDMFVYYPLSYTPQENNFFNIVILFLENFYNLNNKDKNSFKKFIETEKSNN